jgi:hypothetical protein
MLYSELFERRFYQLSESRVSNMLVVPSMKIARKLDQMRDPRKPAAKEYSQYENVDLSFVGQ